MKEELSQAQKMALSLYRWMEHVTKALNDSTIRNKFFREQTNQAKVAFEEFRTEMLDASIKRISKNAKKKS